MKIVKFLGGLGNQMFQYAFYKALLEKERYVFADLSDFKTYNLHNGFELENIFDLTVKKPKKIYLEVLKSRSEKRIYRKIKSLLGLKKSYVQETENFVYTSQFFNLTTSNYFWGYWQNENYFKAIDSKIRKDFEFKLPLNNVNTEMLHKISYTNSISLHIRRGDYVKDPLLGNICNLQYYNAAIAYIQSKINDPIFYVFSDDIDWCIANLNADNLNFINWNKNHESYIDMQLMSHCKHNIIANSSFSWWGAWLNSNKDKIVIAPKKWINDSELTLALPNWIKL